MADDVTGQIKQLASMSRQQLLDLWERLHRKAAHPKIRRELMVPLLAYRIQEMAYGGLKPSTGLSFAASREIWKNLQGQRNSKSGIESVREPGSSASGKGKPMRL